jgi:hypothetical protein
MLNERAFSQLASVTKRLGELGVGAVCSDETGDVIAPMPAAPLTPDGEHRLADVRQGE